MTTIAVLGDRNLDYPTHQALDAALGQLPAGVKGRWVPTDSADAQRLEGFDGLWAAPGTPYRDDAAALAAIGAARAADLPFLGTCGGFQTALVEFARNVAGIADAAHAESEPDAAELVVVPLACSLVGEQRTVTVVPGTRLAAIVGTEPFTGFHWCSYGLADGFAERLAAHGLVVSAHARDAGVEAFELPDRRFFIATLFQPQVGALTGEPLHPLIAAFCAAAAGR